MEWTAQCSFPSLAGTSIHGSLWIAKCQVNLPEAAWDNKWTTQMSFCMLLSTHPQHRSWRSRNRGCGRFTHRSIEWGCSILGGWDEFLGPQKIQATWQSRNEKKSTSFLYGSGLQSYLVINPKWQRAIEICECAVTSAHHCRALSHPEISASTVDVFPPEIQHRYGRNEQVGASTMYASVPMETMDCSIQYGCSFTWG